MKIDIRELVDAAGRFEGDAHVAMEDPVGGEIVAPCRVEVEYRHGHGMLQFDGRVTATLLTTCHRCLDAVRQDLEGDFKVMVRRGEHAAEEGDDVVTLPLHQYDVDLDPFVHEAIVLGMPMIVLCSDACRGLCPVCGINLNRETCACRPDGDSRWDALRKLS
jgi:uncharacterized protein